MEYYTEKEIANFAVIVAIYLRRGNAHDCAEIGGELMSLDSKSRDLLLSIDEMRKIPSGIRNQITIAKADDDTLNHLETICKDHIKKYETSIRKE